MPSARKRARAASSASERRHVTPSRRDTLLERRLCARVVLEEVNLL
jgi:hypothetical protein